jgi:chromosome segregation ATPase
MVEASSRSMYKQRSTKVVTPVIYRRPVYLGTEVPEKPRLEDLLPEPDERAFHIEISKLNRRINQVKKKLAEKTKVHPSGVLSFGEVQERLRRLKENQTALHKERKEVEGKLKLINKEVKVCI